MGVVGFLWFHTASVAPASDDAYNKAFAEGACQWYAQTEKGIDLTCQTCVVQVPVSATVPYKDIKIVTRDCGK